MCIIKKIKNAFQSIAYWYDTSFVLDRLTTLPRKTQSTAMTKRAVKSLRKQYFFSHKTNIAITGDKTCGKKGVVKEFESSRLIKAGKFLHINVPYFMNGYKGTKDIHSLEMAFNKYIEECSRSRALAGELPMAHSPGGEKAKRAFKSFLYNVMIAGVAGFLLHTKEHWQIPLINILQADSLVQYINKSWGSEEIGTIFNIFCFFIMIVCGVNLINTAAEYLMPKFISRLKFTTKLGEVEFERQSSGGCNACNQMIIQDLYKIRGRIGYTVVFENLEKLGKAFIPITEYLCHLNKELNEQSTTWKFWNIVHLVRPIRFIYIYRDDMVQPIIGNKIFDKVISIPPLVRPSMVFNRLREMMEIEASKGAVIPIEKLFPIDPNYEINVCEYLADMRVLNEIAQNYIDKYESFYQTDIPLWEDDVHKLLSYVLFGYFFPNERSKFTSQTIVQFSNENDKKRINPQYSNLYKYLISDDCPDKYRIDFLCKRFVSTYFRPVQDYIRRYEQAYKMGEYKTALMAVEEAICCKQEDENLRAVREIILKDLTETVP